MNNLFSRKSKNNDDIENVLNIDEVDVNNKNNETKNLIGEIIQENKKNSAHKLSHNYNRNKHNINKNIKNLKSLSMPKIIKQPPNVSQFQNYKTKADKINIDTNNTLHKFNPYITSVNFKNIQTNNESKFDNTTSIYMSKKNKKVSFGKSLNETLINNIKEAIIKKGSIIQKIKRKNYSTIIYRSGYSNFNDHDLHKKIFDLKLLEIYEEYQKERSKYKKQRIKELLPNLEQRRLEMRNKLPLYIKGYNKKDLDIVYTRNVCDLDYQRYYNTNQLNLKEILENHNKYNRKDFLSGSIPFFLLTKSVFKPIFRKTISQENVNKKKKRNIRKISL